jgi:hypothetical protein
VPSHDSKPALLHPGRRINWSLVAILAGLLLAWTVLVIAVLRALS